MGKVKFFTIQQCPGGMCDLPHTSGFPGVGAGISKKSREIGTILRKYFPKDGAVRGDHTKAWFPRKYPRKSLSQHLLTAARPAQGPQAPEPADFRCETAQWQVF